MSFYNWVKSLEIINTPEGNLVRDIQDDPQFPKDLDSWEKLSNYLPYDEKIQETAKNLFQSYLADKRHHK